MTGASAGAAARHASGLFGARLFVIVTSGYLMSYGLRAINATIAPELVDEMALTNTQLGSLTSAYFLAFACLQLPLGICLDRFGPRRVDAILMAVAAAGCATFAGAAGFEGLWVARALLGLGFAAGLMAPFALFRVWFAPRHQTRLAAWTMTVGTAGVLLATLPVRALLAVTDWRGVFYACAAVLLAISLLMWFGLPRSREPDGSSRQSFLQSVGGYGEVARSSFFWRIVLISGAVQGGFIAMQTLWLGPWFTRVLQMTPQQSAGWLFVFNAVLLGAYLVAGLLAPRVGQQESATVRLIAVAALLTAGLIGFVAAVPMAAGVWAWLAIAVVTTVFTPIQARVGMSFPRELAGRALTAYNLVVFVATFGVQAGLGVVMDWLIGGGMAQQDAFRAGLAGIAGLQAATWLLFIFWPKRKPAVKPAVS
ncbi:MAG: MFS transporter [Lautropia sp.]|nr:MFS transporter [Lautropia sp.]